MPPARVGIIGAGIVGPILAGLLKLEGYEPVVFERNSGPSEAGIGIGYVALMYQSRTVAEVVSTQTTG